MLKDPTVLAFTPEQEAIRARAIGASEVAAVADVHPWLDKHTVWRRKTGREPPDQPPTLPMLQGTAYEPGVRMLYEYHTGTKLVGVNKTVVHPRYSIVCATPDGVLDGQKVVQIKCPLRLDGWGPDGSQDFPEYIWPQITWEMAATGLPRADVVAKGFADILIYPDCPFDQALFEALLEKAERFWRDYVVADREPPIGHSADTAAYIRQRHPAPTHDDLVIDNSTEVAGLVSTMEAAKASKKQADKIIDACHTQLAARIGDAAGIAGTWGEVTYKAQARKTVDYKGLLAAHRISEGEVSLFTKVSESRTMRVKVAK